jgi:hypothetical protein
VTGDWLLVTGDWPLVAGFWFESEGDLLASWRISSGHHSDLKEPNHQNRHDLTNQLIDPLTKSWLMPFRPCQIKPENDNSEPLEDSSGRRTTSPK